MKDAEYRVKNGNSFSGERKKNRVKENGSKSNTSARVLVFWNFLRPLFSFHGHPPPVLSPQVRPLFVALSLSTTHTPQTGLFFDFSRKVSRGVATKAGVSAGYIFERTIILRSHFPIFSHRRTSLSLFLFAVPPPFFVIGTRGVALLRFNGKYI